MNNSLVKFSCSISGKGNNNIRRFSSAISTCSKIGKEVVLDAGFSGSLTVRCLNDAKTSFIVFEFSRSFFESFVIHEKQLVDVVAKMTVKNLLLVFKNLSQMERLDITLEIQDQIRHVLCFKAHCSHGIVKTYHFFYEEAEALDAQVKTDEAKHHLKARVGTLSEISKHIHGSEEVSMVFFSGVSLKVLSHIATALESEKNQVLPNKNQLVTELEIKEHDFEAFEISVPKTKLIFSVRELKAIIQFCEAEKVSEIDSYFNDPGEPIFFRAALQVPAASAGGAGGGQTDLFSVGLVMATMQLPPEEEESVLLEASNNVATEQPIGGGLEQDNGEVVQENIVRANINEMEKEEEEELRATTKQVDFIVPPTEQEDDDENDNNAMYYNDSEGRLEYNNKNLDFHGKILISDSTNM